MECSPFLSLQSWAPTSGDACSWIHYLQFAAVTAIVLLVLGVIAIEALVCFYFVARKRKLTRELQVPLLVVVILASLLSLVTLGANIVSSVQTIKITKSATATANQVHDQFGLLSDNVSSVVQAMPKVNETYWPFYHQVNTSQGLAVLVRRSQKPIDIQLRVVKDDTEAGTSALALATQRLVELDNSLSEFINSQTDIDLSQIYNLPINVSDSTTLEQSARVTSESMEPLWYNHVQAGVKMQEVLDVITLNRDRLEAVPSKAIHNSDKVLEIMNQIVENLKQASSRAGLIKTQHLDRSIPHILTLLTVIIGIICVLMVLCTCSLPIIMLRKVASRESPKQISDATCMIAGLFLPAFIFVFSVSLFGLMTTYPYCSNGGNDILDPSRIPQEYRLENPRFVDLLNLTSRLTQCKNNETTLDASLYVYEDLRTNSILMPEFEIEFNKVAKELPNIGLVANLFKKFSENVVKFTAAFDSNLDQLRNDSVSYQTYLYNDIVSPALDLRRYPDLNITEFDRLINSVNAITSGRLDLTFVLYNISLFDKTVYDDSRVLDQRQQLVDDYNQIQPKLAVYNSIQTFTNKLQDLTVSNDIVADDIRNITQVSLDGMAALAILEHELKVGYGEQMRKALLSINKTPIKNSLDTLKEMRVGVLENGRCAFIGEFADAAEDKVCGSVYPGVVVSTVSSGAVTFLLAVIAVIAVLMRNFTYGVESQRLIN
ncbi:lipoyl synthase [Acrasis kona]|uniref:Lipoyl synthase n=1 Tax=Acrasis kona TaxID=1008807 RepID=A0AAW2ZF58_9EUKA